VTQIVPLTKYYKAEDYHQDYYRNNSNQGYCRAIIRPKVEKFEKKLKEQAH
jgi:peptide methionine sulfoxide reductase MsrA